MTKGIAISNTIKPKIEDGYIYILTNDFYNTTNGEQLFKIGSTSKNVEERMKQLQRETGVPGKNKKI